MPLTGMQQEVYVCVLIPKLVLYGRPRRFTYQTDKGTSRTPAVCRHVAASHLSHVGIFCYVHYLQYVSTLRSRRKQLNKSYYQTVHESVAHTTDHF